MSKIVEDHNQLLLISLKASSHEIQELIRDESRQTRDVIEALGDRLSHVKLDRDTEQLANLRQLHQSLDFDMIDAREDSIHPAHRETFEWVFRDDILDKERQTGFLNWLKTGDGIYWISGKPECGKSTLMNFILGHHRFQQALDQWSGGQNVLSVGHFFWKSGTELQRSLDGMLRTVLFKALEEAEELMFPVLAPHPKAGKRRDQYTWSTKVLLECFRCLVSQKRIFVALFIDGLDEYNGDTQQLLDILQSSDISSKVKVCLASRPTPPFPRAFSARPGLRLHMLTRDDMERYVEDRLNHSCQQLETSSEPMRTLQKIGLTIVENSEGVFIWTRLVLEQVLRGLENEDLHEDLLGRVQSLPKDIEDLYHDMLDRTHTVYRRQQLAVLATMRYAIRDQFLDAALPAVLVDFLHHDEAQALQAVMQSSRLDRDDTSRHKIEIRVQALFGGLLELSPAWSRGLEDVDSFDMLTFCHRTAADFAESYVTRCDPSTLIDPRRALTIAIVSYLKSSLTIRWESNDGPGLLLRHTAGRLPIYRLLELVISTFMRIAQALDIDSGSSTSDLLDELDRVMTARSGEIIMAASEKFGTSIHHTRRQTHWLLNMIHEASWSAREQEQKREQEQEECQTLKHVRSFSVIHPFHSSPYHPSFADKHRSSLPSRMLTAAHFGLPRYCKQNYEAATSASGILMTLYSTGHHEFFPMRRGHRAHEARMKILSFLDLRVSLANEYVGDQTPWSTFLNFVRSVHRPASYRDDNREADECITDEVEYWLSRGADSSLRLWVLILDEPHGIAVLANISCLDIICYQDPDQGVAQDTKNRLLWLVDRYSSEEPDQVKRPKCEHIGSPIYRLGRYTPRLQQHTLQLCFMNGFHPLVDMFRQTWCIPESSIRLPWLADGRGSIITGYNPFDVSTVAIVNGAIGAQSGRNWKELYNKTSRLHHVSKIFWQLRGEQGNNITLRNLHLEWLGI